MSIGRRRLKIRCRNAVRFGSGLCSISQHWPLITFPATSCVTPKRSDTRYFSVEALVAALDAESRALAYRTAYKTTHDFTRIARREVLPMTLSGLSTSLPEAPA
jgi:hypothetical protein